MIAREMRRVKKEVTDDRKILEIVKECEIMHLGLKDGEKMYIVPLHFGVYAKNGEFTFYAHSATVGRKIDLIEKCPDAFVEMECGIELVPADKACGYSSTFKSFMGEGKAELLEDAEEKKHGLLAIMEHYTQKEWEIPDNMLKAVAVIKVTIDNYSCKVSD